MADILGGVTTHDKVRAALNTTASTMSDTYIDSTEVEDYLRLKFYACNIIYVAILADCAANEEACIALKGLGTYYAAKHVYTNYNSSATAASGALQEISDGYVTTKYDTDSSESVINPLEVIEEKIAFYSSVLIKALGLTPVQTSSLVLAKPDRNYNPQHIISDVEV